MGNKASKQMNDDMNVNKPEDINKIKLPNLLHIIAAKFIIQSTFQDLENLHKPEYCNKLVILASDVMDKHLNNLEVTFLDKNINTDNKITTKSLVYLAKSDLENIDKLDPYDKKNKCVGIAKFYVKIAHLFAAINKTVNPLFTFTDPKTGKQKTVELLDRNLIPKGPKASLSKLNYCTRRIASLKIENDKLIIPNKHCDLNKKVKNIMKGGGQQALTPVPQINNPIKEEPKNEPPKENTLIDKILYPQNFGSSSQQPPQAPQAPAEQQPAEPGMLEKIFNPTPAPLPEKKESIIKTNIYDEDKLGLEQLKTNNVKTKNLYDEIGIPELEKLYFDEYNYQTGKFEAMSDKAKKQYEEDLELFYKTFSGNSIPIDEETKTKKILKFADIKMHDYHNRELCKSKDNPWNQPIEVEDTSLFQNYAEHIRTMIQHNEDNEKKLIDILHKLFNIRNDETTQELIVSINVNLNNNNLTELVEAARKTILQLYIDCEVDFQKGLDLLEAIILYKMEKTSEQRIENFKEKHDKLLGIENKPEEKQPKMPKKSDYDINKGEAIDTTATGDNRSPQEVTQDTLNEFNDKFKNMIDSSRKHLDSISITKQKASKADKKEQ